MAVELHWLDYAVFCLMFVACMGIGIYHALSGGRQKTMGEYYHGNRQMGLIPVAISLLMTYTSTLTFLGTPTEIFSFGAQYALGGLGATLGAFMACSVFVPVYYPLRLTSVNEYLEMRYGVAHIKYIGSCCNVLNGAIFTSFALFGPSTAFEAVTGVPTWICIIFTSIVAVFYTCVGGFKAVIWTDVLQALLMFLGIIGVVIQAVVTVGGLEKIWSIADQWGRLDFFDFDPDPTKRMNFYGVIFGNAFTYLSVYGCLQVGVQRYSSLPTQKKATLSILALIPGQLLNYTLVCLAGLAVFAYYAMEGCDPKNAKQIHNYNQILPYFVGEVFRLPAIRGLFLSCLFSASLSSASSSWNAGASIVWGDLLKPRMTHFSEKKVAIVNKFIVFFIACTSVSLAIMVNQLDGTMVQMVPTLTLVVRVPDIYGKIKSISYLQTPCRPSSPGHQQVAGLCVSAIAGPVAALHIMGVLIPWVNWKGVSVGVLLGASFGLWVILGSFLTDDNWEVLPTPNNCSSASVLLTNGTHLFMDSPYAVLNATASAVTVAQAPAEKSGLEKLYSISFLWVRECVTMVTITVSLIVSFLTGFRRPSSIPYNLVHPLLRKIMTFHPEAAVPNKKKTNIKEDNNNMIPLDDVVYTKALLKEAALPSDYVLCTKVPKEDEDPS